MLTLKLHPRGVLFGCKVLCPSRSYSARFADSVKGNLAAVCVNVGGLAAPILPVVSAPIVDLRGKRALVTGANTGIGFETAKSLASQGAETWLLCRNKDKAEKAQADIVKSSGNDDVHVAIVDFSSLDSVHTFVTEWQERLSPADRTVDLLINNAGE